MTRYQPALRPVVSATEDFRPSSLNSWKKHSARYKLSKKIKLYSKCRHLRLKARTITVYSHLTKADYLQWDKCDENGGKVTLHETTQSTQTMALPPEQLSSREYPMIDEDCCLEDLMKSPRPNETAILPEHVQRRHARRGDVLERIERDLQERCVSRNGLLIWEPLEWSTAIQHQNEMAPLMSENPPEPRRLRRDRFIQSEQDYRSDELNDFSCDFHSERPVREISPVRDREAVKLPPNKRGKLVTFFKNGDPYFRGFTTSVNKKDFRNLQTLMEWLTEKVDMPSGVRFVFSLQDGRQLKSLEEFKHSQCYVVSGSNKLNTSCGYGPKKQRVWATNPMNMDKIRGDDIHLFQALDSHNAFRGTHSSRKPRILTIISNLDRSSREKLILNPQTTLTFEELLYDLTSLIRVPRPPVKALFTERAPHAQIQSYSQLLREYKDHVNFIACGEEGKPAEMIGKRHAPGSNSSTESTSSHPLRKPRKFQKQIYSSSEATHSRTDMSIEASPARVDTSFSRTGKPLASIRQGKRQGGNSSNLDNKQYETVRLNIHGRRKEFYPPTVFDSDDDGAKPDKVLKLDWVYGYRGKDARCNLFVIPTSGELLYFVGAVAVLYDRRKETQRHYCGHSEDITSMALHPGKRLVASGQLAGKTSDSASHVRIWDTISLSTYSIIGLGVFQAGISSVSFSVQSQGDFVLVVDDGEKHTLSVWDWQNSKQAAKTTTTTDMVVWGRFHNLDDSILVTYGKRHIYFWHLVWTSRQEGEGRIVRHKESGIFRDAIPKFVTSLAFSPLGDVVVGDSNGHITVWSRDETDAFRINHACSDHTRNAHKKSVFSLCFLEDGTLLSGGGSEIKTWDSENYYRMIKERALPDSAGYIRTLVPVSESDADVPLYIGTTKNFVLEGSLQHKFKFVIQGHSDKLWALAVHPKDSCFFTAGFDMQVCRWSTIMHTVAWRMQVEKPCVSMTTDPTGKLLVVGTVDGKLVVMSAGNGSNISTTQVSLDKITVVKFSPRMMFQVVCGENRSGKPSTFVSSWHTFAYVVHRYERHPGGYQVIFNKGQTVQRVGQALSPAYCQEDGHTVSAGCQDGTICLYEVMDDGFYLRKISNLQGHKNAVSHMDWSSDNRFLQTVSADYDLFFWEMEDLNHVNSVRAMRDVDWSTQTCVLSYNIIGPWMNLKAGEDIRCVCRSGFREYLAVGTNSGSVKLYKYPSSCQKAQCYSKKSFSSQVTSVQFAMEDRYIISAGGTEAVLMQWALKPLLS